MRRGVVGAVIGVATFGVAAITGAAHDPGGRPLHASKVVLIGAPGLGFGDLTPDGDESPVPHLRALAEEGALAAMNVRTDSDDPSPAEAYASLGAGGRVTVPDGHAVVAGWDETVEGVTGSAALALRNGEHPREGAVVLDVPSLRTRASSHRSLGAPGSLGTRLARDGRPVALVAPSASGPGSEARAAALAATDGRGRVPQASFTEGPVTAQQVLSAATAADVVVASAPVGADEDGGRLASLARLDSLVDGVVGGAPPATLVLVAAVTPPTTRWELTPLVAWQRGMGPAALTSTTTKKAGLVTLANVGSGVASALRPPSAVTGGLRITDRVSIARLDRLRADAVGRGRWYGPAAAVFAIVECALGLAAVALARRGASLRSLLAPAAALAAFPLATYALRAAQVVVASDAAGVAVGVVVLGASAVFVARARDPLMALGWLLAATVGVVLADLAFGAPLETASLFGYSPDTASRFYGIGNSAMALVLAGSLLAAGIALARRKANVAAVGGALALVTLTCAFPTLGAKVGAVGTLLPVTAGAALAWAGRVPVKALLGIAAVALAAVAALVVVDLRLGPSAGSHLAATLRHADASGWSSLVESFARRLDRTLGYATTSLWTEMVVALAGLAVLAVVVARAWTEVLPAGSPMRVAVAATLAGGLWGVLANDSGASVVAITLVFVGPVVITLAAGNAGRIGAAGRGERLP